MTVRLREPQCAREQRDPDSWLTIERLDYSPLAGRWAVVRLVAGLGADAALPAEPRLIVERGQASSSHGAFVSAADRRVLGAHSELLWVASFAVPLEVVECPSAVFALTAPGRAALALPMPGSLILPPTYFADPAFRRWFPGHMRYRLAALATAMAVAASSSSVTGLALAAGGSPGTTHVDYSRTAPDSAWQLPICPPNPPVGFKCRPKPPAKQHRKDPATPAAHKPRPKDPAAPAAHKSRPKDPAAPARTSLGRRIPLATSLPLPPSPPSPPSPGRPGRPSGVPHRPSPPSRLRGPHPPHPPHPPRPPRP